MSIHSSSSGLSGGGGNPFADLTAAARRSTPPSASAIQLLPIRSHVPTILDFEKSNFTVWQTHFNVTFRKLGPVDHINGTVDAQLMEDDIEWSQIDQCIVSWLYTSVSRDILDIIIKPAITTERAWTALNNLFLDNRSQHAIYAKHEFHNLVQGDLTITAYSSHLKCIADTLHDVGSPVSNQDLLLALINGLNGQFGHCITALTINPVGLIFHKARSALLQEERHLARHVQLQQPALYAGCAPPAPALTPPAPRPLAPSSNGGRGRQKC